MTPVLAGIQSTLDELTIRAGMDRTDSMVRRYARHVTKDDSNVHDKMFAIVAETHRRFRGERGPVDREVFSVPAIGEAMDVDDGLPPGRHARDGNRHPVSVRRRAIREFVDLLARVRGRRPVGNRRPVHAAAARGAGRARGGADAAN